MAKRKKSYFVEIVYNNIHKKYAGTRFLRAFVYATSEKEAKQIALDHYRPHYTAGENGQYYVQICRLESTPTRDFVERYYRNILKTRSGGRHLQNYPAFKNKKEILEAWEYCRVEWADEPIAYIPQRGGYCVYIHPSMNMPQEVKFFKGHTKYIYDKAKAFVDENTIKENYFTEF